jgi:hypothetical protein
VVQRRRSENRIDITTHRVDDRQDCHKSIKIQPQKALAMDFARCILLGRPMMRTCLSLFAVLTLAAPLSAQVWPSVPVAEFSQIQLSQFADHELEVPYHLYHFARVANSVVENPFTDGTGTYLPRGFLNIKVNREPADNKPYNARIMEMQAALAYFYTADRPWNPYRGSAAVRVRLEAMLQRWTEMQAPPGNSFNGLFTEYSASNWSLAPTSFGARAAAEALDLIIDSGLSVDPVILENSRLSLRRALMAVFTRSDMRNAAKQYSNQFTGIYQAALIYLENWPDAELDAVFVAAVKASSAQDQSPAGFWYEQGGPDFGYSSVHETSMRMALPRFRNRADLMPDLIADDNDWNEWLAANYVPQPGLADRSFQINSGINTRTGQAFQTPRSRPWSEFVSGSRFLALTDTEFAASVASRRVQVAAQFGKWGVLSVPSGYSYIPAFVHDARASLDTWHPTAAQRNAAESELPCYSPVDLNRQFHDPLPTTYTLVKRPNYYASVTTGNIRIPRQVYGLGLLWNPAFGIGLQSQAGTLSGNSRVFGSKRAGMTSTYETSNVPATITAGGSVVTAANGVRTLPSGDVAITYNLAVSGTTYGSKTLTLGSGSVNVAITHSGDFSESLPLAHADDAVLTTSPNQLVLQRPNGSSLLLEITTPGATLTSGATSLLTTDVVWRPVTINANGSLAYRITLSSAPPPPPVPTLSVADAAVDQPISGTSVVEFPVTLSTPATAPVTVSYSTAAGSALAGTHFVSATNTLEFLPGQIRKIVQIAVLPGSLEQGSSLDFALTLGPPSGALAGRSSAIGTIRGSTPSPPPPPGSVLVEFVPGNAWDGAYQGNFRITNSSSATITGWELAFDFSGTSITFFNGNLSRSGTRCILTPLVWQSTIAPGASLDNLGFQGSPNLPSAIPTNLVLRITSATGVAPLQIAAVTLPPITPAAPFSATLTAGGGIGPYRWAFAPSTNPPPGVTLGESGQLAGAVGAAGSFPLPVRVTDARGVSADASLTLTVTAPDPYAAWNASIAWLERNSAANADPDADGITNFMEYALGGDPLAADPSIQPHMLMENGIVALRFQRHADPALLYQVLARSAPETGLEAWDVIWSSTGAANATGLITVNDTPPDPPPAKRFLRLRVSRSGAN